MKTRSAMLILSLLAVSAALGREDIAITATKKTLDERKGGEQDLWRGTSRSLEKTIYYDIEITVWSPAVPLDVKVEWLILIEGAGGRLFPGTFGEKSIGLALGQPLTMPTEPVKLEGREWTGGPNPGTVQDRVAGYAVRVLSTDGKVLAEKYEPVSVKGDADWSLLDEGRTGTRTGPPARRSPLRRP